ncbi:hypothetical protein [Massilia sp. PWRC2]|uniref:hypothetical protein n=1 Tax=Massilia sp. PWRC2 TaxID=2804626 RepID=UPI003CF57A1D
MPLDQNQQKEAVKQAIREWMDDAFTTFGKWTFKGLMAAAFAGCVYLALKGNGWTR